MKLSTKAHELRQALGAELDRVNTAMMVDSIIEADLVALEEREAEIIDEIITIDLIYS